MQKFNSSVSTPITSSASFSYINSNEAKDIFSGNVNKPLYSRLGNPTSSTLENIMTTFEKGVGAVASSSGMGAISMAVMSLCSANDEIIAIGGLFGGSYALFTQTLPRFGIKTHFFDVDEFENIQNSINKNTKIIFCESVGNPNLRLPDLQKIGKIANRNKILFIVDNTITPIIVRPFEYGANIVIYSTTKIISGNSSALGGITIVNEIKDNDKFHTSRYDFLKPFINKLGEKALVGCLKKRALRDFGMSANANASYQTILGLETLELRTRQINSSCELIAKKLQDANIDVNHPSLANNIDHDRYKKLYKNGCGTIITVDMQTQEKAFTFLDNSNLLTLTANIGDSRTLGLHMASTIYADFNEEEKKFLGITDGLIRLSIGLEDPMIIADDLIECFKKTNT